MEFEQLEALAFGSDRSPQAAQLVPGTPDYDYFTCVRLQQSGELDQAQRVIDGWAASHGEDDQLSRLQQRQLLARWRAAPADAALAGEVAELLNIDHTHEPQDRVADAALPSRIDVQTLQPAALLASLVLEDRTLATATEYALPRLVEHKLTQAQRQTLLEKIGPSQAAAVLALVVEDLQRHGLSSFGGRPIHAWLSRAQLDQVAQRIAGLSASLPWWCARWERLRPPSFVQWPARSAARSEYLIAVYQDMATLPEPFRVIKFWALGHLLAEELLHGRRHDQWFLEYMDLRNAELLLERKQPDDGTRRANVQQAATALGLDAYVSVDIVGLYLAAYVATTGAVPVAVAARFDRAWLERCLAEQRLLAGKSQSDADAVLLGASVVAGLAAQTVLELCAHNPVTFAAHAAVTLDVDVKNIERVTVKAYRIDPIAYFAATGRAVGIDLDLDGITASYEQVEIIARPPIERVRRSFAVPSCTRPGTYIVEFIGGGIASRTLIHKGRLRCVARPSCAGTVITVFDQADARLEAAQSGPAVQPRLWLAGREFVADAHNEIVVPLTASFAHQTALVVAGELATVVELPLYGETIELLASMVVAREHLSAGNRVRAIADVTLRIAGVAASLQLLRNVRWELTLRAVDGTVTTKAEPLVLSDSAAAVLEWKLPDDITSVEIAITATCDRQRDGGATPLRTLSVMALPTPPIDSAPASDPITELLLVRHAAGAAICCLGRNGEPMVGRPVVLRLQHRFSSNQVMVTLQTDQRGEVQLGVVDELVGLSASFGELTRQWTFAQPQLALASRAGRCDDYLVIPLQGGSFDERTFAAQLPFATLVEVRGRVVVQHVTAAPVWHDGAIRLPLLAPGNYQFAMPGLGRVELLVLPDSTLKYGDYLCASDVVAVQPPMPPRITSVQLSSQRLRVRFTGVDASTSVHLVATQFATALTEVLTRPIAGFCTERTAPLQAHVINGRDLGDEVRYVFDRKHAVRRPGPLLDKPSLLLHPWARQATVTNTMTASFGASMSAPAPAPSMRSMRRMAKEAYEPVADALTNTSFVACNSNVLANVPLQGDSDGTAPSASIDVDLAPLVGASLRIVVCDSRGRVEYDVYRERQALQTRDLRLQLAIAPDRHVAERRKIDIARPGQPLVVRDIATAKLRAVETVDKLYGYLVALSDTAVAAVLAEFSFVTSWHTLTRAAKLDLYQRFACHELHLFVFFKDVTFFENVVAPALATKRRKTFIDEWLLNLPLQRHFAPGHFAQLNACERALLAQRSSNQRGIARVLTDDIHAQGTDRSEPRRVAAMLLGAAMDDDAVLAGLQQAAQESQVVAGRGGMRSEIQADYDDSSDDESLEEAKAEYAEDRPSPKRAAPPSASKVGGGPGGPGDMELDRARRSQAPAVFQVLDKTQEWAESNWWHMRPTQSAGLIAANSFWQALATCAPEHLRSFLHADVGLCVDSFAAAMCALALSDLPFATAVLGYAEDQGDVAVTTAAPALLASAQLLTSALVEPATIVLVQNYLQANQRTVWRDGESHEVYVVGELMVGVPYVVQAVVSNASAQPVRGEVLMQVPRGAITLGAGGATMRHPLDLAPYTTTTFESVFYFPAAGTWSHFPAHATAGGEVLGAALPRVLHVVPHAAQLNADNWDDVANRVALPTLLDYLRTRALGPNQELNALAWRLRDRAAYEAILAALEERCRFDDVLWGYALLHGDAPRGLQLLQHRRFVDATEPDVGPAFAEAELMDDEDLAAYEHLEFAPLISARAHALRGRNHILNEGLAQQYRGFLQLVAHRAQPTAADRIAAVHYLLATDRIDDGARVFASVDRALCGSAMQYDYMAAYLAICSSDITLAQRLVTPWLGCQVPRWARRFTAIAQLCNELLNPGAADAVAEAPTGSGPDRTAQLAALATTQAACTIETQRDGVVLASQNLAQIELRFFAIDAELLFSKQPFAQADVARFAFVEPTLAVTVALTSPRQLVAWPSAVAGRNVVVEVRGPGISMVRSHYANDLVVTVTHNAGRLRVVRSADNTPRSAAYVKAYGRGANGVAFYKDGYTDLRGWFDYASLSTDDLDRTSEFSILVVDDECGAAVVSAQPPLR